ncbi:MAG: YihY/virulence factor BrkB family protein [Bacteroidota bacterium]
MKKRIIRFVKNSAPYKAFLSLLKRVKFKKAGTTLYDIVEIFYSKITKDSIIEKAEAVAFNFILAIFPAIIFLFTLIPVINRFIPDVNKDSILEFIGDWMPANMFDVVSSTVEDIIGNLRGGLLTFGALFSLYMATNGMMALMKAFNSCYKTVESRGFFKTRLIATGLTVMLAMVLILAILLLVVGQFLIGFFQENVTWLNIDNYTFYLILGLRFLVIFIVFFLAISFIYYFGPAVHYGWRFFSIGSVVSTILCLGISYGFSFYVTNFATYNKLYGSIGVLIALMIWQFILSIVLLVGYELNASIHKAKAQVNELASEAVC